MSRRVIFSLALLALLLGVLAGNAPDVKAGSPADNAGSFKVLFFNYIDAGGTECPEHKAVASGFDTIINKYWPEGTSPIPGVVNTENYMVCWKGEIYIPQPGAWTVHTCNDDGMNVWVDDQIWMNAWYDQGPTPHDGTLNLAAGTHKLEVKYYNRTLGATAKVAWTPAGWPNPVNCNPTPPPPPPPPPCCVPPQPPPQPCCAPQPCQPWNPSCYPQPVPQPVPQPIPQPLPPMPPKPVYACLYRVQWGDNLTQIAWKFGTTTWQLQQWNKLYNPDFIYAGMTLRVCAY